MKMRLTNCTSYSGMIDLMMRCTRMLPLPDGERALRTMFRKSKRQSQFAKLQPFQETGTLVPASVIVDVRTAKGESTTDPGSPDMVKPLTWKFGKRNTPLLRCTYDMQSRGIHHEPPRNEIQTHVIYKPTPTKRERVMTTKTRTNVRCDVRCVPW